MNSLIDTQYNNLNFNHAKETQIVYNKSTNFRIIPKLSKQSKNDLIIFLQLMIHNDENLCYLFWTLDKNRESIIINDKIHSVSSDVFNQLTIIANWLFKNNYYLEGISSYSIDNVTEIIIMRNNSKSINHQILFNKSIQDFRQEDFFSNHPDGKQTSKINNFDHQMSLQNNSYYTNSECSIESLEERLTYVENKLLKIKKFHNELWKYCTIINAMACGTLLLMFVVFK